MAETVRRVICRTFAAQVRGYLTGSGTDDVLVVLHNAETPAELQPGVRYVVILDGEWEVMGKPDTRGMNMRQHVIVEGIVSVAALADDQETRDALAEALDDLYQRVLRAVLSNPTMDGKALNAIEELAGETTLPEPLGTQPTAGFSAEFGIGYRYSWQDPTV